MKKNLHLFVSMLIIGIISSYNLIAQTTINTTIGSTGYNGTNSNGGNSFISFVITNNSPSDIVLQSVGNWTNNTDNSATYSLYQSSVSLVGAPPTAYPATGWNLLQSGLPSITSTALSVNNVLTNINFIIPVGAVHRFVLRTKIGRAHV